ncbi:MAG TPA: Mur ligase family protein [Feifaniaceae bacterium]|nr:Mur ligase family protein [Feifaniaceae bacterium]
MTGIWNSIFAVLAAGATTFAALHTVHMLQLESYQGNMYVKWVRRAGAQDCLLSFLLSSVAFLLRIAWVFFYYSQPMTAAILWYGADAAFIGLMLYIGFSNRKLPAKKPLAFTGRVKRLLVCFFLLSFLFHMGLFLPYDISGWGGILGMNFVRYLPGLLLPFFVLLAHAVMLPVENSVKRWYYNDAKKKLNARPDLIRIGITGSYGKTSTKFILGTILQEEWNTLVTPGSFNTPMGITRVVREQLKPEHKTFVAEMGARYRGDIAELCRLVQPKYGIITSVGKQHLDTFGSYEAVIETKAELLNALPEDGAAFLNGDNPDCRRMYERLKLKNKFLFGLSGSGLYVKAEDIEVSSSGSTFTLVTDTGERVRCATQLLGKHNIGNITGAAALARYLGASLESIAIGIENLAPVEHRLQLMQGQNGVTVIDDAFNANPSGTKAALEVLKSFAPARRIVVTPGMIELGGEEERFNEEFGRDIARAADIAILVGRGRVAPIRQGLIDGGFPEDCIVQADTLSEATEKLPLYAQPGCVVLFENDLPDNYDKA